MEDKYVSRGTTVAFPLNTNADENTTTIEHVAKSSQEVKKENLASYCNGSSIAVTDVLHLNHHQNSESESEASEIIYRFTNPNIENYPSVIHLEKVKHFHLDDTQSNCFYRNGYYIANHLCNHPSSHQAFHVPNHPIQQSSHVEVNDVSGGGGGGGEVESCISEGEPQETQTIWGKIRRVLGIFRRESSVRFQQLNNAINLQELLVYGLKKYDSLCSKRSKSNMHVIKVKFPNLNITANYELNNWTFLSRKFNGSGKMDLTLNNVRAKIVISTIQEVENVRMMTPNVQVETKSGWIHFSELNGFDNTLLNRNFKQTLKALAPSINEIVSKKIIEKFAFVPNLFNDAF